MTAQLHHIALAVRDFEESVKFFREVFSMEVRREEGEAPHRRIWFRQGIQLNEDLNAPVEPGMYHHIGMGVDDMAQAICRAKAYGCTQLPGKDKWLVTKDGLLIELMV